MGKLLQAAKDWIAVIIAFGGAVLSAYDAVSQISEKGNFSPGVLFGIGVILFLFFGCIAIIRAIKKARDAENSVLSKIYPQPNPVISGDNSAIAGDGSTIIKASGNGKAAGRDINETL